MDERLGDGPIPYLKAHPLILVLLLLSLSGFGLGGFSLLFSLSPEPNRITSVPSLVDLKLTVAVDVEGEVAHPGLIEIVAKEGQVVRVSDAIAQAGGLLPSADTEYVERNLNLAAPLTDGVKLYVPKKGEMTATSQTSQGLGGKINVNLAPLESLETLKGIGEARAKTIIANRPYTSLEELGNKAKLSAALLEGLKDEISF